MGKRSRESTAVESPAALIYPPSRSIELEPEDWLWATWRPRTPLPQSEPQPFDRKEALSRLEKVIAANPTNNRGWSEAQISMSLSQEEAVFWFLAITGFVPRRGYEEIKQTLSTVSLASTLSAEQAITVLNRAPIYSVVPELIIPLANLFPLPELIDLLSDDRLFQPQINQPPDWAGLLQLLPIPNLPTYPNHRSFDWRVLWTLVHGFRRYCLPYLSQTEIAALHSRLQPKLDPAQWYLRPVVSERMGLFLLAAVLGMHNELLKLVETWNEESCKQDCYYISQEIVFGLGEPKLVEYHMRRLKLPVIVRHVPAWFAHTEHTALDYVREQLVDSYLAQRVKLPEAAPYMLELSLSYCPAKPARQWLQDNPAQAIAGLIPVAAGRDRLSEAAIDFLRLMKRKGYEAYIRQCLSDQPSEVASKVQILVLDFKDIPPFDHATPLWWHQVFEQHPVSKGKKTPTWIDPLELPPILIGQHCLNSQQIAHLLTALKQSTLTTLHPVIPVLKTHAHPSSLNDFAWRLFQIWLSEGASPKENWAMIAVGILGNDAAVLKLTPLLKEMPGEGHHKRAALGLECLRTIGTDTALMQINTIAQKVKYKGLKQKAEECIATIAQTRNLSREQLEDRIVPGCSLNQRGTRIFDYGSRQFYFVFSGEMQPMVRDGDGKIKPNLPKPKAGDDTALAEQAITDWKILKQQVQTVVKTQADRLERAMFTQRHWQLNEFESYLVNHPLMTSFAQRLLWGVYDASKLLVTFRVTEDLTYADATDQTLAIDADAEVGIVHPAQLSQELRNTWGELFSDYELIQPFRQLSRTVFGLAPEEVGRHALTRFQEVDVEFMTLTAILLKTGWKPTNNPVKPAHYHCKSFPFANITAVIEHPTNFFRGLGTATTWFQSCFFIPGIAFSIDTIPLENALKLGDVHPVVMSEVLRNLGAIAAKGE